MQRQIYIFITNFKYNNKSLCLPIVYNIEVKLSKRKFFKKFPSLNKIPDIFLISSRYKNIPENSRFL